MQLVARNLTDAFDGFLLGARYLIVDRDPLIYPGLPRSAGSQRLPSPPPSSLNAFAERFVLSIKFECLSKIILLGGAHLQEALR